MPWQDDYIEQINRHSRLAVCAARAILLAVIFASSCAIGEECGWRRVCEVPETQIEWEEAPSHVRSPSRSVGSLDLGLSNGLPASDCGRIAELARALDHDPDKCYRYVPYDFTHWEWSWPHAGQTALDVIAVIPVVGSLKYADEAETLFKRSLERVKSTNSHARKQVDDVAREFGLTGAERKEFGKYIEELKEDVDHMSGAQNYSYQELREIAREFKEK